MPKPILISIYNFKGGVGKTTATHNIGNLLSKLGLKVLLVDADPQCNLTGLIKVKSFKDVEQSKAFYQQAEQKRINNRKLITMGDIFAPIIADRSPSSLDDAKNVEITQAHNQNNNLFFIPGHIQTAELDQKIALGLSGALGPYNNHSGYITNLFREIGKINGIDIILFDLSPSFGIFNGSVIIGSDYFLVPFYADFFSLQAIQSLEEKIPKWYTDIHAADSKRDSFGRINEKIRPKFLGAYPQKVKVRKSPDGKSKLEQAYGSWVEEIYKEVDKFIAILRKNKMLSDQFSSKQIAGVIDSVAAGMDVQASGRPITDIDYPHRHPQVDRPANYEMLPEDAQKPTKTRTRKFAAREDNKKVQVYHAYLKVVGAYIKNLNLEDLKLLAESSPLLAEKLGSYSSVGLNIDPAPYIQVPQSPLLMSDEHQDEHWYDDREMNILLQHYFSQDTRLAHHDAVSDREEKGEILRNAVQEIRNQISNNPGKDRAVLSVHTRENHWVLLYILTSKTSNPVKTDIYYFDPFGDPVSEFVLKAVRGVYSDPDPNKQQQIIPFEDRVQNNGYDCGPWVIEAARQLVKAGGIPDRTFDISGKRQEHERIISGKQRRLNETTRTTPRSISDQSELRRKNRTTEPTDSKSSVQQPTSSSRSSFYHSLVVASASTSSRSFDNRPSDMEIDDDGSSHTAARVVTRRKS